MERTASRAFNDRLIRVPLLIGAVGMAWYLLYLSGVADGGFGRFADQWIYQVVLAAGALACIGRARADRRERLGWLALGGGLLAWTAGDVYWTLAFFDDPSRVAFPSPADVGYLAAYPLMYVGIVALIRSGGHVDAGRWLDGAIGGLAAAALGTAILAPALVGLTHGDPAAVATNLAYPLGDMLLIAIVVSALLVSGADAGRRWLLIGGGLLVWGIADATYLYQEATGSYDGGLLDGLWPAGALMIAAAAAIRPSEDARAAPAHTVGVAAACAMVAISVLVWDHFDRIHVLSICLASATLGAVVIRLVLTFGENNRLMRAMHRETVTDSLTGLPNRRALLADLDRRISYPGRRAVFAIFDLDGFKAYNDSFGHPAGDLLLRRMGSNLAAAIAPTGRAYRLGGDEFCVLVDAHRAEEAMMVAGAALTEAGEGFDISSSSGTALLPSEASDAAEALRVADRRMYVEKGRRANSAERQTRDVLVRILREREPELGRHLAGVAELAVRLGRDIGVEGEELDVIARAAELHDVGKVGIPERILQHPGPLDDVEWDLVRTHTLIGERILGAAPAMLPVARLVRSSHEHWDGGGYPDGLAGEEIPVGARIISICDAFEAITSERPYSAARTVREALVVLRAAAGTQFDPMLVTRFCVLIEAGAAEAVAEA